MRYEYSPGLLAALERARWWAKQAGFHEVFPLHLFQALIEDQECSARQVLELAGMHSPALTARFLEPAPDVDPQVSDLREGELPLAVSTHELLARSRNVLRQTESENTITRDHVLLALLEADSSLCRELESMGLDFLRLRQTLVPPPVEIPVEETLAPEDMEEPLEIVATFRILDVNANRAREALRILEEIARFHREEGMLSQAWKQLRHDLDQALDRLPRSWLLQARDTPHDVGTAISTDREGHRASWTQVLSANAKRLQEALRCLEEFGKLVDAEFSRAVEQLRYRSYTVEKALELTQDARDRLAGVQLYVLVTETLCRHSLVGTVSEALAGGAQVIQLREKQDSDRQLLEKAREVRRLTRAAGALFIVNDRPDIARLADADGVHLGQDDLPLHLARRLLGPDRLIGVSTHHLDQVRSAVRAGADYIGVGPTFPSKTKEFDHFPGLDFVREVVRETSLPAFVLGGVNLDNVQQVLDAGAGRVAVSQAVSGAEDPRQAAREFRRRLKAGERRGVSQP